MIFTKGREGSEEGNSHKKHEKPQKGGEKGNNVQKGTLNMEKRTIEIGIAIEIKILPAVIGPRGRGQL